MDPMTMMAIANFGMQMMGSMGDKNKPQQGGQGQQPQQPQMQKAPFQPGPLPGLNTTDYGAMIKNMLNQNTPQAPMAAGMAGI